jgi:hypothetical protein
MVDQIVPDDQQEDESDIVGEVRFRDSVVVNADWTIETLNSQIAKGNIDLQPRFQRRAAWDDVRKSRLIESIIVGMPVPNIVLAESKTQRGKFIVIDGKQRLVAISRFISGEFALKGLDIRSDLNEKRYESLGTDDKDSLDNSTIRSTVIKNWQDENFLYAIFYRLNSGSLPLSPQELRKALTGGDLIDFIEDYLGRSAAFKSLFGGELDKRMRDSELVLRFIAFDLFLPTYNGNFKDFLDNATRYFEQDWSSRKQEVEQVMDRLDASLLAASELFGQDVFKKWLGDKSERVMNRAVFDCVVRYFADEAPRTAALQNRDAVVGAFRLLCQDQSFKDAIERTTKSKAATFLRLRLWGEALSAAVSLSFNGDTLRVE